MYKRQTWPDLIVQGLIVVLLIAASLVTIIPFLNVFLVAITPTQELVRNAGAFLHIPAAPTLEHYRYILSGHSPIIKAMGVTITRTVIGTLINLVVTALTAYPLSKRKLPGGGKIMMAFVFTMLFNAGMIPTYLVVKSYHILDTIWALILPTALSVYNMIILRTFFRSLPEELEEAARIDGCSDLGILFRIVVPLSMPAFASIGLFYAVNHWNAFIDSVLYITDRNLWPLQLLLREILLTSSVAEATVNNALADTLVPPAMAVMSASIMISAVPIMLVYPFLQRHFVKGIMIGSVKG